MEALTTFLSQWFNLPKSYAPFVDWGVRAAIVLLIFIIVAFLARRKRIERIIEWLDEKVGVIELTSADRSFFSSVIRGAFWLAGWFAIFYTLKLTAVLATVGLSAGVLTTVAAIANKELIGNVFGGLVIQARRQVAPGDVIKILDITGTLHTIGLTSCEVVTFEGVPHHIPNAKMLNEVLTNYSQAGFRRATIDFCYDPDESYPEDLEAVIEELIAETEGLAEGKTSGFVYGALTEKGQNVSINLYFSPDNWYKNASNARRIFLEKLDESDVQIGVPQILTLQVEEPEDEKKTKKKK